MELFQTCRLPKPAPCDSQNAKKPPQQGAIPRRFPPRIFWPDF
jgi:hypothetical protein